jgi:hypothetical protein
MKSCALIRSALIASLGLGLFLAPSAYSQDTNNVRVVRLSRTEGQVVVSPAGTNVWEDAPVNLPLEEGDTLATQGGYAEIEFENGATGYLAENSVLQFTQLGFSGGGRSTDLTLAQGAGTFYANLTNQDTFRVQALTFDVTIPERAEFRVDGFKDGAAVQVLTGDVSVSTTKGSTKLDKGQSVAVHEKDFGDFSIGSLPTAEDAFDQWVTEEGEMIRAGNKNTLSYINSPNIYGLSDLSRYGSWVNVAGFGFSWRPFSVGFTWTPYFNGHWILNPLLGWTWVSNEPWGWVPFHFGSWLLSPDLGWLWVPGGANGLRQWQGARVNWVSVGGQVGWVAMSPNDRNGTAANALQGVITKSGRASGSGIDSNVVLAGKDLRTISSLKQPPAEFASHLAPGTPHSGVQSSNRMPPRPPNENQSIVFDRETRTFINRDGRNENNGSRPGVVNNGNGVPVAPAALMPRTNSSMEVPRVTLPQHGPADSHMNRVILPPAYPTAPGMRGNNPNNGMIPARPPMIPPLNSQPRPGVPPPVTGVLGGGMPGVVRVPSPPPAMPRPATPPSTPSAPSAPHTAATPLGSVTPPAAHTPEPASRPGTGDRR